jgi:Spy/CpxP family protein refolding chaperone
VSPINAGRNRPSKKIAHHRARVGALSRDRAPDDPEFIAAKRELLYANTEAHINKVLAAAPPLTPDQRAKLAELLAPARQHILKRAKTSRRGGTA